MLIQYYNTECADHHDPPRLIICLCIWFTPVRGYSYTDTAHTHALSRSDDTLGGLEL